MAEITKSNKNIKYILTHKRPGHVDDGLAVALLLQKYPDADIIFVYPQDIETLNKYDNDESIWVDVGGIFDPDRKRYDHHQDLDIPCSLIQILEYEFPEIWNLILSDISMLNDFEFIDMADRYGVNTASANMNKRPLALWSNMLKYAEDKEEFMIIGRLLMKYFNDMIEFYNLVDNSDLIYYAGLSCVLDKYSLRMGKLMNIYQADIVIQPNKMDTRSTAIYRNNKRQDIDLNKLKNYYNVEFIHEGGFIAVIKEPFDKIKVEAKNILKILSNID